MDRVSMEKWLVPGYSLYEYAAAVAFADRTIY
jgi:hypothetical protein